MYPFCVQCEFFETLCTVNQIANKQFIDNIELCLIDHAQESSHSFRISSFVTGQPTDLDIWASCRARYSKHGYEML
jgi:hypothetical protein